VVAAVHKLRTDVAEVFAKTIGTDPDNSDVHYLAESQREATRSLILAADAGMTGCNFAVAETGSEFDLSANVPKLHIASVGIEKTIPIRPVLAYSAHREGRSQCCGQNPAVGGLEKIVGGTDKSPLGTHLFATSASSSVARSGMRP